MAISRTLNVNGARVTTAVDDLEMPLLYLLRGNLGLHGPRFGCGLAQQSRTLAEYLRDATVRVRLTLVDIPTLRQEFLLWWGRRAGIPTTFLPCTAETPIPELPECDLCQAAGFFEHVHDPVAYFNRIDAKLAVGGLLITGIMDHHEDFMHMSPQLGALRMRIAERGYETLVGDRILRKG